MSKNSAEEDLSVFEIEVREDENNLERTVFENENDPDHVVDFRRPSLHKSLSGKTIKRMSVSNPLYSSLREDSVRLRRLSKSVYINENVDYDVLHFWKGEFALAESAFEARKASDPMSALRYGQLHFMKYILTYDQTLLTNSANAFANAEAISVARSLVLCESLAEATKAQTPKRRMSSVSKMMGAVFKQNPGALCASKLSIDERAKLDEWKRIQGIIAMSLVFQAMSHFINGSILRATMMFRKSWTVCRLAQANIESHSDIPTTLHLISAVFYLAFSVLSLSILRVFKVDEETFESKGITMAETIINTCTPESELHAYATLLLILYYVYLAQDDYRIDNMTYLKSAFEHADPIVRNHPDWVMFSLAHSHVLRRMGRIVDAQTLVSNTRLQVQTELSGYSVNLTLDLANIHFVQKQWDACERMLTQLLEDELAEYGYVNMLLAACYAMRGYERQSETWILKAKKSPAWEREIEVFLNRPHKEILFYELCYLFGFIKWFDVNISGTLKEGKIEGWADSAMFEILRIKEEITIDVVHTDAESSKPVAREELLAISFICGIVCAFQNKIKEAMVHFNTVLSNNIMKSKRQWHAPFSHYELAVLEIRQSNMQEARKHLNKCGAYSGFSFEKMLRENVKQALEYIVICVHREPRWKTVTNELGVSVGGSMTPVKKLKTACVEKNSKFEITVPVNKGTWTTWTWAVDTHSIKFQVFFISSSDSTLSEVEALRMVETNEFQEGFFTAIEEGVLKFEWDNTDSKYTDRRIQFNIF